MENLNMNLSSLNEPEVRIVLLKALELENEECLKMTENVKKLNQRIFELEQEKKNDATMFENIKNKLTEEIETLSKKNCKLLERFVSSIKKFKNLLSQCDKEINQLKTENTNKEKTIEQLKLDFEQYRVCVVKKAVLDNVSMLKNEFDSIKDAKFKGLSDYVNSIFKDVEKLDEKLETVDDLCKCLLRPDGVVSKVCNLIWWSNSIKDVYDTVLKDKYVLSLLNQIVASLESVGYKVNIPSAGFSGEISNYELYENALSKIKTIFPDTTFEQSVFCEIYSVSYNDVEGKCYSL